ncbi:S26 family signal peptidase [Pelagibius sp. Alg239-R121]|uniref:S26 family signal peptidase n=1 Tax=Pelagibius sp. Alg239-R121 TaxID=2993448 RepID=UPI0024A718E7|nr:S26 family signal peptidase [Pelagibius sp. Alg239-R121]
MLSKDTKISSGRVQERLLRGSHGDWGGSVSHRSWKISAVLLLAGVTSAAFVGSTRVDAPLLLWNDSPSMDAGIYLKAKYPPAAGAIVSVEIPEAAQLYAAQRSIEITWGSFLKPIAAVGGDRVCVSLDEGLVINGKKRAEVRHRDSSGNVIAVWQQCRKLLNNEYFLYASRIPESYDSRYYGPVRRKTIKGVYEPLWTW